MQNGTSPLEISCALQVMALPVNGYKDVCVNIELASRCVAGTQALRLVQPRVHHGRRVHRLEGEGPSIFFKVTFFVHSFIGRI